MKLNVRQRSRAALKGLKHVNQIWTIQGTLGAPSFQQQVTPIHFIVCLLFEPLEERLDQHPVSFSKPVFVLKLDNFFCWFRFGSLV